MALFALRMAHKAFGLGLFDCFAESLCEAFTDQSTALADFDCLMPGDDGSRRHIQAASRCVVSLRPAPWISVVMVVVVHGWFSGRIASIRFWMPAIRAS